MKSSKEKRALIAGMIGCLLYVIGDFLFAATGKIQSTESAGHLLVLVLVLGLVLLREMAKCGECKETVQCNTWVCPWGCGLCLHRHTENS